MLSDITKAITADPRAEFGFSRTEVLQAEFDDAKKRLLAGDAWRTEDGEVPPGDPELRCDLALEGGGVKGIGLVGAILVVSEAGYKIQRVAGTSAGAIAASLTAALVQAGHPLPELKQHLDTLVFANFMPEGRVRHFLDHVGRRPGEILGDVGVLTEKMGLYPGTYLYDWLRPILEGLNVRTFKDLRITQAQDPGMSLPVEQQYRLVVHVSDITRQELVRLPWDYGYYGQIADEMSVLDAVRASMSIPFFFEPFEFTAKEAIVKVPGPGGETIEAHYAPGTVTWVDGGMLRNFPINAFDRLDGKASRWPTIGIKLSKFQDTYGPTQHCGNTINEATGCLHTMMNEWDRYSIEETSAARTIFVDNAGITATEFHLTPDQQNQLFINGVAAATQFVIQMGQLGHIPSDPVEVRGLVALRRALTEGAP